MTFWPFSTYCDGLADAAEAGDPVPFGVLDPATIGVLEDLAVAVALGTRGGEAELGDLGAALGGADFGGGTDVAGEDDEVLHFEVPLLLAGGPSPRLNTKKDGQDAHSTESAQTRRGTPIRGVVRAAA